VQASSKNNNFRLKGDATVEKGSFYQVPLLVKDLVV
jgi:hypothetical protein